MDTIKPKVDRNWENYWLTQSPNVPKSHVYVPSQPSKVQSLGELLYIFRPIIYCSFFLLPFLRLNSTHIAISCSNIFCKKWKEIVETLDNFTYR